MKAEQRFPGPAFIYTVFLPRATEFLVSSKRRGVCLAQAQSLSADREPCPSLRGDSVLRECFLGNHGKMIWEGKSDQLGAL